MMSCISVITAQSIVVQSESRTGGKEEKNLRISIILVSGRRKRKAKEREEKKKKNSHTCTYTQYRDKQNKSNGHLLVKTNLNRNC